jgi:3,4-dihydroxy 2-butanone 4-phosphate synthase/GTP cyclohydrolase II
MVQTLAERGNYQARSLRHPISRSVVDGALVSAELAAGRPVVVLGSGAADGQLVFAADIADVAVMAFAVRHTSGFLCVGLPADRCDELELPPMWPTHSAPHRVPYTVTVDAAAGIATGISAADRAHTVRLLGGERAVASDFTRPGHVVVAATPGTGSFLDAIVNLVARAGHPPAAVFGAIVSSLDPTKMAGSRELMLFARRHDLLLTSVHAQEGAA